jgi:hypothetical protein
MTFNINKRTKNLLLVILLPIIAWAIVWEAKDFNKRMTQFSCAADTVIVEHYDTIWAIVRRNCEGNMSEAVDRTVETYGTSIQIGQQIFLPRNQDCHLTYLEDGNVTEEC